MKNQENKDLTTETVAKEEVSALKLKDKEIVVPTSTLEETNVLKEDKQATNLISETQVAGTISQEISRNLRKKTILRNYTFISFLIALAMVITASHYYSKKEI